MNRFLSRFLAVLLFLMPLLILGDEFGSHQNGLATTPINGQQISGQFTTTTGGTVTQGCARIANSDIVDHNFKIALFANGAGAPAAKLAETAAIVAPAAITDWVCGSFSTSISASTTYHIGILGDSTQIEIKDTRPGDISTQMSYKAATYPNFVDPFNRDGTVDRRPEIYLVYTPAGGSNNKRLMLFGVGQ